MNNLTKAIFAVSLMVLSINCSSENKDWQNAKNLNTIQGYEHFKKKYPKSSLSDSATLKIEKLSYKEPCYYIVQPADKGYWDIAERILGNEKRWKQLEELNGELKSEDLKVGQKILIPCD